MRTFSSRSEAERVRSYFGEFMLNDIYIEIMGDIQKRMNKGEWEAPISLSERTIEIMYRGLTVPILPLKNEIASYRKMGRHEQVDQLEKWYLGEDGA
ncbi:MAG TPA: hypothetical protein VF199_09160 [Bacillales bacterium]